MADQGDQFWAVIPATGIGHRMQADRPKQYLQLGSQTILEHTLDNLLSHSKIAGAVLVLNQNDSYWKTLNYQHEKSVHICVGGEQRHNSVYNGLIYLKEKFKSDIHVLIHDAVRPFVSHDDLDCLIEAVVLADDGAILATPVSDTLKYASNEQLILNTHPRDHLWRALTPQAFRLEVILKVLKLVIDKNQLITDDASAMELAGFKPRLISADNRNIKITQPQDLQLAQLLLKFNP